MPFFVVRGCAGKAAAFVDIKICTKPSICVYDMIKILRCTVCRIIEIEYEVVNALGFVVVYTQKDVADL